MSTVDDRHAELSLDEFRRFCVALNSLRQDPEAQPGFDGMSGGFKFSDEFAEEFRGLDGEMLLRLVGWLRCLWGYRISLVLETPRSELADYSFATQHHKLVRGLDRLDKESRLRQSPQPGS